MDPTSEREALVSGFFRGREARGDVSIEADIVVCGSGAGGGMAARELARSGLRVVVLEEGGDHVASDFTQREDEMIPLLFQDMGGRRTEDLGVLILSGRGLGGSTVHNTNLCKRTPAEILARWHEDHGVAHASVREMQPFFEEVERDLGVVPIHPLRVNGNNRRLREGVERLGYAGGMLSHNRDERCIGSGFCELGCAYDGKLNVRRVLLPQAVAAGATVWSDAHVTRITIENGEATGAEATLSDALGRARHSLRVRARAVCLAGSAVGSATLALRSGVHDPHQRVGRSLRIHPGSIVAGIFNDAVESWRGIPQSYECTEFLDLRKESQRRVWIVPSFAHPIGAAALSPGFGPALMRGMRKYPRTAVLAGMIHDETEGRVYLDGDRTRIDYVPDDADREQLALGAREAARILLAAGAREASVQAAVPMVIRTERELSTITADRFRPNDAKLTAVHPMGTLCMGDNPETSVVNSRGRHHHVAGLYVVDGSLFPTSIGGPPQMSIYAFSMRTSRYLIEDMRARA